MSASETSTRRQALIGLCLGMALLLVAALAYEAVTAAREHRRTAESVLRDYAELAAEQYASNLAISIEYEWIYPLMRLLDGSGEWPDSDTLFQGQRHEHRVGAVVESFFRMDLTTETVTQSPQAGNAQTIERIRDHARDAWNDEWPHASIIVGTPDGARLIAYRLDTDASGGRVASGFDSRPDGLAAFFDEALRLYALLPESLTDGTDTENLVAVRVLDALGQEIFRSGDRPRAALVASVPLRDRFADVVVEAAIRPEAAGRLVVGGLPAARWPLIAALLLIAVALVGAAGALLRREQELVRLREEFVAGASHELRTPLAQIRMFTETMRLDRVRSDDERRRYLDILDREARRLTFLVENLLQFSRAQRRRDAFAPEPGDLGALVAEVVEGFAPLAAARNTRIVVRVDGDAVLAFDRDLMQQVLLNLLDNATKYGPAGQTVTVAVAPRRSGSREEVVLSVEDEGPGVPADARTRIWERFWRGDAGNGITGTGIGLALVRDLVDLHGGQVGVADLDSGGARFVVRLPRGQTPSDTRGPTPRGTS